MKAGTVVGATLCCFALHEKWDGKRVPGMNSARVGDYNFGIKAHIGVGAGTSQVHAVKLSPVGVRDRGIFVTKRVCAGVPRLS